RLGQCIDRLEDALGGHPEGRKRAWIEGIRTALAEVRQAVLEHARADESPDGGLFANLDEMNSGSLPKVTREQEHLRKEHARLFAEITKLDGLLQLGTAPSSPQEAWLQLRWGEVRAQGQALLAAL